MKSLLTWCLFIAAIQSFATDWYVTNSVDLQRCLTNIAIVGGDNVWIYSGIYTPYLTNQFSIIGEDINGDTVGSYEPSWIFGLNGSTYSATNWITYRSATNNWATIDGVWRDISQQQDSNGTCQWGYIELRDLEIVDSMKGHHATNYCCGGNYTNGPWSHFALKYTYGQKFVNCVAHDTCNLFSGNANGGAHYIQGCVVWHVGLANLDHVCYPSPNTFCGNIVGWTVQSVIEGTVTNALITSNIVFGSGQTSSSESGLDMRLNGYNATLSGNFTYGSFPAQPHANGIYLDGSGMLIMTNNVFVSSAPLGFQCNPVGYANVTVSNNIVVMNEQDSNSGQSGGLNTNNQAGSFNYNAYFDDNPNQPNAFVWTIPNTNCGINYLNFGQWKTQTGFDTASTTNNGAPTNMVFVIPNHDQVKRCHLAVYNFDSNNVVPVNLSGVLAAGDTYQLFNAQDYGRGAIQTGTYNGINLTVPMTNLTTAPILYGTNWGLFQPPPMSPTFGAFVVIGQSAGTCSVGTMTVQQLHLQ